MAKLRLKCGSWGGGRDVSLESLSGATGMGLSGFTPKEGEGRPRAVKGKESPEDTE